MPSGNHIFVLTVVLQSLNRQLIGLNVLLFRVGKRSIKVQETAEHGKLIIYNT